ncbi:hypothetical protein [Halobacillus sp. Cin3]|uniref:hypothetical protein n=1 Tax=Halobacillus sp. Cin3 TaxID=2928441 RepID=UPI00248F3E38|nr:hypothetical protein [Halobacillus sp. Cin3]
MKVEFDNQFYEIIAEKVAEKLATKMERTSEPTLPLILSRDDVKEILDIGQNKTSELMSILPKIKGFSHPKIPSKSFLEWINENTEWVEKNAGKDAKVFSVV